MQLFLGTALLWKTSCDLVLKGEFYENGEPTFFIIIKRYREVDSSFKKKKPKKKTRHYEGKCIFENHLKKVDTELNSDFQLLHRHFFSKVCY